MELDRKVLMKVTPFQLWRFRVYMCFSLLQGEKKTVGRVHLLITDEAGAAFFEIRLQ